MNGFSPVRRVSAPKNKDELDDLLRQNSPLILTEAFTDLSHWNSAFLSDFLGDALLPVRDFKREEDPFRFSLVESTFRDLVPKLKDEKSRLFLAGPNLLLHQDLHVVSLFESVVKKDWFSSSHFVEEACLWAARAGQRSHCHFDVCHNLLHVIEGEKDVILAAPCSFKDMNTYRSQLDSVDRRMLRFSQYNLREERPENVELFSTRVLPGETLLIPLAWFHDVLSVGLCLSFNLFLHGTKEETDKYRWMKIFL